MSRKPSICREIEADLLAAAMGEAESAAVRRVQQHLGPCADCRREFEQYRAIDGLVGELRGVTPPDAGIARARHSLESRLADLRGRLVTYCVFPSPLGRILIACSEQGVALVEYLRSTARPAASRLYRIAGVEAQEDGAELEALSRELLEYLEGKRTRLEWPLDLRLARSEFQRRVLQATARIPYGAVVSYTGIAWNVGRPSTSRAVAQALRWNPLPIVVPCHRVIGASGSLTGYAGNRIDLKRKLLATEGIPIAETPRDIQIVRETMYVRYPGDEAYCLPTCASLASLTPARLTLFGSRARAEAVGLKPCTDCRPDLHPIS
jgi:methylated-DNA-[protein]-cysteine S-methyltransferase